MKIATIDPAGIHAQEVKAHQLEKLLPDEWYGYASLEMLDRQSGPMQVDLVICAFDRVLLVEVKNGNNGIWEISEEGRKWLAKQSRG